MSEIAFARSIASEVEPANLGLSGPSALTTVLLIARITFREAVRRRILVVAVLAALGFLALFGVGVHAMLQNMRLKQGLLQQREAVAMMSTMALYAGSMLTSLMAALTSCDTLSGEIASGTIHAIATKPVRRWALVFGKWIGFAGMLSLYVLLLEGGTILIAWGQTGRILPHTGEAIGLLWVQALVLLGVSLAASTRFSAMTSGAVALGLFGLAFVGGWIEQYGALQHVRTCVNLGILSSLIMPSDALWRRTAFRLQPPLLGSAGIGPFSSSLIPSTAMVMYAIVYAAIAILLAVLLFERRDL
jgi:Cu-processing system permease protein